MFRAVEHGLFSDRRSRAVLPQPPDIIGLFQHDSQRTRPTGGWVRRRRPLARLLAAVSVLLLLGVTLPSAAQARYASIVVDAASGRVLYARNIDTRLYPASMTKMMTLYLLFEALDQGKVTLDTRLRVSARAAGQAPSKLGLLEGSTISVRDAMKALVTKSANDVATVVAEALGGTEITFARLMTERAHSLGMTRTSFRNASGLPNSGQKSTARDMAILAMSLQQHFPQYYDLFSTRSFKYGGHTYGNHNNLMKRYSGADGLKTGYISASGFNLAFSARRGGHRLVGVVFGGRSARSRDDHMAELMDKAFAKVTRPTYVSFSSTSDRLRVVTRPDLPSAMAPPPPALPPGKGRATTQVAEAATPQTSGSRVVSLSLVSTANAAVMPTSPSENPVPVPVARPAQIEAGPHMISLPGGATVPLPARPPEAAVSGNAVQEDVGAADTDGGRWGIQVGAFSSQRTAEQVAHDSARLLAGRLDAVQVDVIPHTVDDGRVFRARLVGLTSEGEARKACNALKANGRSCLVVVPTGWTVAAR